MSYILRMSKFTAQEDRIFLLDCIELVSTLFLGPVQATCPGLALTGVAALAAAPEAEACGLNEPLAALAALLPPSDSEEAFCEDLAQTHVRLFITAKGGVPAPPYESCHTGAGDRVATMGPQALAMRERLDVAGLNSGDEPPDHVGVELGYLYFLLHDAWMADGRPVSEAATFASGMHPWCVRFAGAVGAADNGGYFHRASELLVALMEVTAGLDVTA